MSAKTTLWAKHALTPEGWASDVRIEIDQSGLIMSVLAGQQAVGEQVGLLLPAMANLHSHAFQRAMAGMTETRGSDPEDSFWSWRKLMYRFLNHLCPDDCEAIAAFGQLEMLEAGYTSVGEFHYLHHQASGEPYANRAEMSERMVAAADQSGIGLTLLPVLYEQGGCDGRALAGGQKRFGNTIDEYTELFSQASVVVANIDNANIGIAPHSLRAASQESLKLAHELAAGKPFHIHIAEQQAEVDELLSYYKARPVEWLLENHEIDNSWCLIHATQMTAIETEQLAASTAVAGLCPITESNLGDGIFDGKRYLAHAGNWGIGTDSNVRISLSEELRTLEYSQRLRDMRRAVYATSEQSNGRVLYESALAGGAQALQRKSGCIAPGYQADLLSLDITSTSFLGVRNDGWLDAWLFAHDDSLITDVWANGQQVVTGGQHIHRAKIESKYRTIMKKLTALL